VLNTALVTAVSFAWLLALALGAARLLRWTIGESRLISDRQTAVVLLALTMLLAAGITWGLPGPSWAPDEIDPLAVRQAISRHFAGGWHDKYPPFHFGVLALAAAPVLLAEHWALLAPDVVADDVLMVQFRLVSLTMAFGCLVLVGALGRRVTPASRRWLVILCGAIFLPFAYYAKTANLDVPYTFWLLLSFVLLADIHEHGRRRDFVAFGAAAALAVATKDQAFGFYLLPGIHLVWTTRRIRLVALSLASAAATFLLAHNAIANPSGLLAHVGVLVGPASANYRMFPMTMTGQAELASATFQCLTLSAGWAGGLLLVSGLTARQVRPPVWIGLAALSYYVTFLVPAGYVYDRFLLPVLLLLAPTAAAGLERLLAGVPTRASGRLLALAVVAVLVWRTVSLDVLLTRDSRYAAEAWLSANVPDGATVGYPSLTLYLPRLEAYDHVLITPTIADTSRARPDFIVVNTEWLQRFEPGSPRRLWFDWLERGTGPYRQVFRYKDPLRGTAFAWTTRFTDRVEDPLTNLDKVNPEIAIFELRTPVR
jgi:hypothetical protein